MNTNANGVATSRDYLVGLCDIALIFQVTQEKKKKEKRQVSKESKLLISHVKD